MKILLSGFVPFGHHKENPSQKLVETLCLEAHQGYSLEGIILPVTFKNSFPILEEKIKHMKPDYVICFGLAENRHNISLEEIATNINNARVPDNNGYRPINEVIDPNGKSNLHTTLPIYDWLAIADNNNFPVSISQNAGSYVCNSTMYQVIQLGNKEGFGAGFIHISKEVDEVLINKVIKVFLSSL